MDWFAFTVALAESHSQPMIIVDGVGRVQFCNAPSQNLFAEHLTPMMHSPLIEVMHFASPDHDGAWIARACRGALVHHKVEVLNGAERLRLTLRFRALGNGPELGLLIVVEAVETITALQPRELLLDHTYVISLETGHHGDVVDLAIVASTEPAPALATDMPCYAFFHGRSDACVHCPVDGLMRSKERQHVSVSHKNGAYEIRTATREPGAKKASIAVRSVSDLTFAAIYECKVGELATAAHLSEREAAVLRMLAFGKTFEDIAEALAISRRTVKFHQTNLLQKLGADSRADLLRLLV